jgi:plasmid stability protein
MVFHMKTTMNIDDQIMRDLKAEAARRGITMTALVEAGLRLVLSESRKPEEPPLPELPSWDSGGLRIDVADRGALFDVVDAERWR